MILSAAGHLHDGGVNVQLYQNGEMFCDSVATYGVGEGGSHHHGGAGGPAKAPSGARNADMPMHKRQLAGGNYSNTEIPHITSLKRCDYPQGRPMRPGDALYISANYDLIKYPGVKDADGKMDMVMGMGLARSTLLLEIQAASALYPHLQ